MNHQFVQSLKGITLVGGGPVSATLFRQAQLIAPVIVAADGGADRCLRLGVHPEAVIGDMDSASARARAVIGEDRFHLLPEQVSTDFDKALRSISAPFVLAVGFIGGRADHGLAVFNGLVQSPARCLLLSPQDVIFHAPPRLQLNLRRGDRFSLFPLAALTAESKGLIWPLTGINFTPAGRIGTSNQVSDGRVQLQVSGPGMLCILPRARLPQVLEAISSPPVPSWP